MKPRPTAVRQFVVDMFVFLFSAPELAPTRLDGYDIRTIQEMLGHNVEATTMMCTHLLNRVGKGVRSPVNAL